MRKVMDYADGGDVHMKIKSREAQDRRRCKKEHDAQNNYNFRLCVCVFAPQCLLLWFCDNPTSSPSARLAGTAA